MVGRGGGGSRYAVVMHMCVGASGGMRGRGTLGVMYDMWTFLVDVLVVLAAAMVFGAVCERLKQSAMVGYLLAGVLLGPNALGLPANSDGVNNIAQLGVALLLFSIGLEFSVGQLKDLGWRTLVGGLLQIGVTISLTAIVVLLCGLSVRAGLAIGAALACSSTAVVLPTLAQRAEMDSVHGRFCMGVLLLQDAAVVPLVLLVTALAGGGSAIEVAVDAGKSLVLLGGFVFVFFLFAKFVLPILMRFGSTLRNREMPILFGTVVALGSAWLANEVGLSAALGAFLGGIFLGGTMAATQFRGDIAPLKTLFATLFFAAIGMYADPKWIVFHAPLVLGVLLSVIVGKAVIIWLVGLMIGLEQRHAAAAGLCMSQIGVFSFVLLLVARGSGQTSGTGSEGQSVEAGIISGQVFDLMVAVTILTLIATPYLINNAPGLGGLIERWLRRMKIVRREASPPALASSRVEGHVIVIGFGPAGRKVVDELTSGEEKTPVAVIDLNPRSVLAAREMDLPAYMGDAGSSEILNLVQVATAKAVVVTLPDHRAAIATIQQVRRLAPNMKVIARARYKRYLDDLRDAGAHEVIDEESSVGEHLGDAARAAL